jgi:hypothetical protein
MESRGFTGLLPSEIHVSAFEAELSALSDAVLVASRNLIDLPEGIARVRSVLAKASGFGRKLLWLSTYS